MLRAAVAAGTPVGLKAKDIMAQRRPGAGRGGDRHHLRPHRAGRRRQRLHPRRLPAHRAAGRGAGRAAEGQGPRRSTPSSNCASTRARCWRGSRPASPRCARGARSRAPTTTPRRWRSDSAAYRAQTEPLVEYYSEKRKLLTVDGMMTIDEVTREIGRDPRRARRGRRQEGRQELDRQARGEEGRARSRPRLQGRQPRLLPARRRRRPAKSRGEKSFGQEGG